MTFINGEEPIEQIAGRLQSVWSEHLTTEDGEVMGTGPAAYETARLIKNMVTGIKAALLEQAYDMADTVDDSHDLVREMRMAFERWKVSNPAPYVRENDGPKSWIK